MERENIDPQESFFGACSAGNVKEMITLLDMDEVSVHAQDKWDNTPLFSAVISGKVEAIELLNQYGAKFDVKNQEGETLLHFAARLGDIEVSKLLVNKFKLDVDARNNVEQAPIHEAVRYGIIRSIECLMGLGANINTQGPIGETPLTLAMIQSQRDAVQFLVKEMLPAFQTTNL